DDGGRARPIELLAASDAVLTAKLRATDTSLHVLQTLNRDGNALILEEAALRARFIVGRSVVGVVERDARVRTDQRAEVHEGAPQHGRRARRALESIVFASRSGRTARHRERAHLTVTRIFAV